MNNSTKKTAKVIIVGGGITGLACAYRCFELSQQKKFPLEVLLLESSQRLGGVISTSTAEGCLIESGPDAIFTEKPWGLDFCKKIGLENEIVGTNPNFRASFIEIKEKLIPVPEGFYLLAPSKIFPLITTPLFSWKGKLRMLGDLFIPRKQDNSDESLASFVRRRLGNEALERLAQPMIGGIYSANPEELSLQATFPAFLEMEQKYGSVTRGLMMRKRESPKSQARGPRYSLFISFKDGMQALVKKIIEKIPPSSFRLGAKVNEIVLQGGSSGRFKLRGDNFEMDADAICLALPTVQTEKILNTLDKQLSSELGKISYGSTITVNLIYKRENISHPLNGFGFVVPAIEKKTISGCSFSSVKFLERASRDKVILRAFIGGKSCEDAISLEDKEIVALVQKDLEKTLGILGPPLFFQVQRHLRSLPQYRPGHLDVLKNIEERLSAHPDLALAGNSFYGVGIPECIRSGETAAEKILANLQKCS